MDTYQIGEDKTADEVLGDMDLSNKRVLVTGVSGGLGLETCRVLAARGAHIVGTVRDLEKGRAATADVAAGAPGGFELVELDLGSLKSVRRCAESLLNSGEPFDVVICNAGVMATPQGTTTDGFETQFGINHLGHFLLVNLIVPLLHRGARVIVLSSMAHRMGDIDLEDPNFQRRPYDAGLSYAAAKTATTLFAVELDKRLRGRGVRVAAVHPGIIFSTGLTRYMDPKILSAFIESQEEHPDVHHRDKTIPQGAATSVWTAFVANADDVGGRYCQDCRVVPTDDSSEVPRAGPRAYAVDPARAATLWKISEEMVGETFAA